MYHMPDSDGKLRELEHRIEALEKIVLSKDEPKDWPKNYSGLKGGMNLLPSTNHIATKNSWKGFGQF